VKKILCIAGRSGAGKSMIAGYIERRHGIPLVRNYTDRPRRYEGEKGYQFVTREEMDELLKEDVLSDTNFGGHRYCCLERDLKETNVHVLDERGIDQLLDRFGRVYDIPKVLVVATEKTRMKRVGRERVERDGGRFYKKLSDYDHVLVNESSKEKAFEQADRVLEAEGYVQ
jgi:guanylate kinase